MKRKGIVWITLTILVATMFTITACTEKNQDEVPAEFSYKIAYAESFLGMDIPFGAAYANMDNGEDFIGKIDSLNALKQLSIDKGYPFFDENNEDYSTSLASKIRSYDENYFVDSSLILMFIVGKKFDVARIEDVVLKDSAIEVTFTRPDIVYESDDLTTYAYILEVNKAAVEGVTEVKTEYISDGIVVSPEQAYEEGLISQNELRSIAYYFQGNREYVVGEGYVNSQYEPLDIVPESIDTHTENIIKRAYLDYFFAVGIGFEQGLTRQNTSLSESDISLRYLGTYSGYIAASIEMGGLGVPHVTTIGGISINYPQSNSTIVLWKKTI